MGRKLRAGDLAERQWCGQSSIEITHPICLGSLVFNRRYGLFERRRHIV
jgi:hypothetical protein